MKAFDKCVFAGSFDPVTNGHMDVIGKCAMMFESVVVALAVNAEKNYTFKKDVRLAMLEAACKKYSSVKVVAHDGLIVDLLRAENAVYYVRGVRNEKDEEYEKLAFDFNSKLYPEIQTIFLSPSKDNQKTSSTLVKELLASGKSVERLVPFEILPYLKNKA